MCDASGTCPVAMLSLAGGSSLFGFLWGERAGIASVQRLGDYRVNGAAIAGLVAVSVCEPPLTRVSIATSGYVSVMFVMPHFGQGPVRRHCSMRPNTAKMRAVL